MLLLFKSKLVITRVICIKVTCAEKVCYENERQIKKNHHWKPLGTDFQKKQFCLSREVFEERVYGLGMRFLVYIFAKIYISTVKFCFKHKKISSEVIQTKQRSQFGFKLGI